MNNPVIYKDSTGYVIELASNATKEQKKAYRAAIAYLRKSPTARALIERLDNAEVKITIRLNTKWSSYSKENREVFWIPNNGTLLKNGTIQSAALVLLHELGHAAQHLDGLLIGGDIEQRIEEEEHNVANYETPVATELGEPTRSSYFDGIGSYIMSNSTECRNFQLSFTARVALVM